VKIPTVYHRVLQVKARRLRLVLLSKLTVAENCRNT